MEERGTASHDIEGGRAADEHGLIRRLLNEVGQHGRETFAFSADGIDGLDFIG